MSSPTLPEPARFEPPTWNPRQMLSVRRVKARVEVTFQVVQAPPESPSEPPSKQEEDDEEG